AGRLPAPDKLRPAAGLLPVQADRLRRDPRLRAEPCPHQRSEEDGSLQRLSGRAVRARPYGTAAPDRVWRMAQSGRSSPWQRATSAFSVARIPFSSSIFTSISAICSSASRLTSALERALSS